MQSALVFSGSAPFYGECESQEKNKQYVLINNLN